MLKKFQFLIGSKACLNHANVKRKIVRKNEEIQRGDTSTILPFGRPPPKAKSKVKQPLGNVSLQWTNIRLHKVKFLQLYLGQPWCYFQKLIPQKQIKTKKVPKKGAKPNFNDRERNTYTKAPPALPNLVTLPFPNELFISFIAASSAFCWGKK